MKPTFTLDDTRAIVTGGAGRLGEQVARGLAAQNAEVVIADVASDRGEQIERETDGVRFREVDVTDGAELRAVIEETAAEGSLDALVNCAYPRNENYGQGYADVTLADWRENVGMHLDSYFYAAREASLVMADQPSGGSIVNFGSIYGVQGPDFTVYEGTDLTSPVEYAAIKGAITNLTRFMASRLGPEGVRVNTVSPGGVAADQPEQFVEQYEERTPLGRMATPEDVVGAVVFLLSDAGQYVTGHNLVVDGGWTIS